MKPHELEILKEELGLTGIDDPDAVRAAIQEKFESMNAIDRFAVQANIGRKAQEAEAKSPATLYSPPSGFLLAAGGLCLAFFLAAMLVIVKTEFWVGFKILAGVVGVWFFLLACSGFRRIVYRIVNGRDL